MLNTGAQPEIRNLPDTHPFHPRLAPGSRIKILFYDQLTEKRNRSEFHSSDKPFIMVLIFCQLKSGDAAAKKG